MAQPTIFSWKKRHQRMSTILYEVEYACFMLELGRATEDALEALDTPEWHSGQDELERRRQLGTERTWEG